MVEDGGAQGPEVGPSADQPTEVQQPGMAEPGSTEGSSAAESTPEDAAQPEGALEAAAHPEAAPDVIGQPEAAPEVTALPGPESAVSSPLAAYAPPPTGPPVSLTAPAGPAPAYPPQPPSYPPQPPSYAPQPPPQQLQGGWQPAPGGWPAMPYPTADTTGWYWCPNHLIASEKEGNCPTCGQPFQPAPPWGIPAGPYRPKVSILHRSRREKVAYFAAGLVLAVLALGTVVGLAALYRHGTPLDSNGQPVTSDAVAGAPGGGSVSSSTDSNNSRLQLHSLEGKNLVLVGHWTQTTQIYRVMIDLARSLTSDNTQPPLDIAASKGTSTVAVFNVPSSNPATTISDHTQATSVSSSDTGGVVNIAASQNVTIDGKASNYTDITSVDTTGKTVLALRVFFIPTTNHVVMVAVATRDTRDDINTVSQALQTLQ